jgi:hypothetical protein
MSQAMKKHMNKASRFLLREVLCSQLFWPLFKKSPNLYLGSEEEKYTRKANILAIQGNFQQAAFLLSDVLRIDPKNRNAAISLGAILSLERIEDPEALWSRISAVWSALGVNDLKDCFPFYCACIENLWDVNPDLAKESITSFYYPFFKQFEMLVHRRDEAFLFWHIPKSGGTSLHEVVGSYYYRSGLKFVPSYTSRRFLAFLVENDDSFFPFLSSAHMPAKLLGLKEPSYRKEVLILRDPVSRAMSAYRQYRGSPESRLKILPQHGYLWNFLPVKNSLAWVEQAPQEVINPIGYTFGCLSRIQKVDEVFDISELNKDPIKVVRSLGCEMALNSIRSKKNSTGKKIKFSADAKEILKQRVALDKKIVDAALGSPS